MNKEIRQALIGPIPSISTPFKKDGDIDYDCLRDMIEFYISHGAKTMMLTAGDSHYVCMSEKEIAEVTKVVVEQTAGRSMVIAADRYYNTKQAVEFAKYVAELGADLLMVMPPDWAGSMTPQTVAEHYRTVSEHMLVMIVTNVFIARGMNFGMEAMKLCLGAKNIVAVKDDFCGAFARKMALLVHDKWAVVSGGQKQNHLDVHPYGCDGYLSTYMRFKPEIALRYWKAIEDNKLRDAVEIIEKYDMPYFDLVCSLEGQFNSGLHGALELFGLAKRWRRKPYLSISDKDMEKLAALFKEKGLI